MSTSNLVGQIFGGRYQIQTLIGQGGMASVYKAYDSNLRRDVAIKVIHPHLSSNPEFFHRFEEEATAVARLRHPNIVQVYDFSHDGDLYYMVMEYVVGETLQTKQKRLNETGQRLSVSEVIKYAAEICEAVNYAHSRGMIHRDIKPANIMLDIDGRAILMDFGIVRMVGSSLHTATGTMLGTAIYSSPEQIQGTLIDARTDIYSIGITLFEMLNGKPPFNVESALTLMMMHLNDPLPDLHRLQPDIPPELITITYKALEKDRDKRYQSAGEMAAALRKLSGQLPRHSEAVTLSSQSFQKTPDVTIIEPVVLKDSGKTTIEIPGSSARASAEYQPTVIEPNIQSIKAKPESAAGTFQGDKSQSNKKNQAWLSIISPLLIIIMGIGGYLAYSRFLAGGVIPAPTELTSVSSPIPAANVSPVVIARISPTEPQQISTPFVPVLSTPSPTSVQATADFVSPHGKIVYTCQVHRDPERNQLCIINADGTGFRQLTDVSSNYYPSLAPDGKSVIFVSFRTDQWEIYEMSLSTGETKQVTYGSEEWAAPEISPDGNYIVAANNIGNVSQIWIMDRNGGNQHPLVELDVDCVDPTWSADGGTILFACGPANGRQLYTLDLSENKIDKLTEISDLRGRSDWSQDGNQIATYIGPEWKREIVILSKDGKLLNYLTAGGNNLAPSYSPDGAWIAFMSYKDLYSDIDGCEIYIMRNNGEGVRRLTQNDYCDWQPRWGP